MFKDIGSMTSTTFFLLYPMGFDLKELRNMGFKNAYLEDVDNENKYKDAVYLLFKIPEDKKVKFNEWIERYQELGTLMIEDYDLEGGYTVVVFLFPDEFLKDKQLILDGKFSKVSKPFFDKFPKEVHKKLPNGVVIGKKPSIYFQIFNKTDDLRKYQEDQTGIEFTDDMEFWSSPTLEREILNIKEIIQKEEEKQQKQE